MTSASSHADSLRAPVRAHFDAIPVGWRKLLHQPSVNDASRRVAGFLDARIAAGVRVYPPNPFAALTDCDPGNVRVVILGQDPYHGPGQAQGLAFSVPRGVRLPPSLRNIFLELQQEGLCPQIPPSGDLSFWADQGVLLWNAVLTVEEGQANSHAGKGWEIITAAVLDAVARDPAPKVFLLWGAYAQARREKIEEAGGGRHCILAANHPSPLSARRPPVPFLGCGHFSRANQFLATHGREPVVWWR